MVSMGVNLVLAIGLGVKMTSGNGKLIAGDGAKAATAATAASAQTKEVGMASLSAGDEPRAVRDALRAVGVSEVLVRNFVTQAVWAKHHCEESQKARAEWWKESNHPNQVVPVPPATVRAVNAEVRALMGDDIRDSRQGDRLAFLPEAKRAEAMRIYGDYEEMSSEIYSDMMSFQMPEDQKRCELLNRERDRDLQALLTPEEFAEVTLLQSPAGQRARMVAGQLDLTEAEFREVVKMRQEADRLAAGNPTTASSQSQDAEARFEAQLTQLVGEDRMREQSLKNSRDYEVLQKAQARLGLSQETVDGVLAQRYYVRDATTQIMTSSGTAEEKREALKKLAAGVKTEVTRLLGPAAAQGYFTQNGMPWLRDMERGRSVHFTVSGWAETIEVK